MNLKRWSNARHSTRAVRARLSLLAIDHRPLDSRIKGARCAAVGCEIAQDVIALFGAHCSSEDFPCRQKVSAMCRRHRSQLSVLAI